MRYDQNNWGLRIAPPMRVSCTADLELLGQVPADGHLKEAQMLFKRPGFSSNQTNEPLVQVQIITGPLQALSVLCQPAHAQTNFQAFRLLVLNESDPPRHFDLNRHFLNLNATKLPDLLKEPLRGRLGLFRPVSSARWQLRPRVGPKDGTIDILKNWPGEPNRKPQLGDQVNLASLKKPLEDELKDLTNRVAELDKEISTATNAIQPNVDLGLPLGKWFELTNADLVSFDEYFKAQPGRNRSPGLYLGYLDQIAKQARPEHPWVRTWTAPRGPKEELIAPGLLALRELCVTNLPVNKSACLTLEGPTTSYFLAVWKNLKNQETERVRQREKESINDKIDKLKTRLDMIPSRLDQITALSLCVVGPNDKPLEMIRFSNASAGKSP
jgi:hypothetical protein